MSRICHITASLSALGGGIPFVLQALTLAQNRAGIAVRMVGHDDGGETLVGWPDDCPTALDIKRVPGMVWAGSMRHAIRGDETDLLHTHGLWSQGSIIVPQVARRAKIPYVISPHGMLDDWALANSALKKQVAAVLFENRHLRGAACLHALCEPEAKAMRAYGLKNPVCVIPNGVELAQENTETEQPKAERKILLFLGRLHPKKGLVNALRAWAKVRRQATGGRKQEEWQFVIAGWDQGGHRAELEKLCQELDISVASVSADQYLTEEPKHRNIETPASVVFLGPAFGETKDALLRAAAAFILPSFSEGLPMSILEAWSYRLPVLMTDHCNLPEGFAAEAALRITTDVESIAREMQVLVSTRTSDLRSLGDNGRELVSERFTWQQIAIQMKEVYEWILGGGEKPSCIT